MDIKAVYKQLTNVDISQQRQLWDERGKGYYGEFLLFCELYKSLLGNGKILMNLNVPLDNSKTTEIDLVLIHETGLYVFEIKHYKGTIYGKDTDTHWTQYFRTVKNNTFRNPMEQNRYHVNALKKLFPEIPIVSCVVFTNDDCDLHVRNSNCDVDICHLRYVRQTLQNRFVKSPNAFSMEEIDTLFQTLSAYSQMKEPVTIDGKEADFSSWIQPTITALENERADVKKERLRLLADRDDLKKSKVRGIVYNVAIAVVCVVVSVLICIFVIQGKNNELAEFKQNFLHVDEINNDYIDTLNSYVAVSNVSLSPLADRAVTFSARISMTNDIYGVALTENSKYIVITSSGKAMEYDVFGEHLRYSKINNMIGKGIRDYGNLASAQFFGISDVNDISYIKITEVELFKLDIRKTTVKDKLEIELYSK